MAGVEEEGVEAAEGGVVGTGCREDGESRNNSSGETRDGRPTQAPSTSPTTPHRPSLGATHANSPATGGTTTDDHSQAAGEEGEEGAGVAGGR